MTINLSNSPTTKQILQNQATKITVLFVAIIVIYLRYPPYFLQPRLWAEEGTRYFIYAYQHNWYESLTNVAMGYFSLWPNLATFVAANLSSLEYVPLVTTLFALVVQIIPLIIILWSRATFWVNDVMKLFGVAIILFTPFSDEVWLNTINSQFYFLIITFLILLEDTNTATFKKWSYRILLFVAGLTGSVSLFLTPMFIFKAWHEKNFERILHTILLIVCGLIQVAVLWTAYQSNSLPPRFERFDLAIIISIIWTRTVFLLLFGYENAIVFAELIQTAFRLNNMGFRFLNGVLLVTELIIVLIFIQRLEIQKRIILTGSYFLVAILVIITSLGGEKNILITPPYGNRYFYAPNVIFLFLILANIRFDKTMFKTIYSTCSFILLSLILMQGISYYWVEPYIVGLPTWQEQISVWRENPQKKLIQIWPKDWTIWLGKPLYYKFTDKLTLRGIHNEMNNKGFLTTLVWDGLPLIDDVAAQGYFYTAYAHLTDKAGVRITGSDVLLEKTISTINDPFYSYHTLIYPSNMAPGSYDLVIGIYYMKHEQVIDVKSVTLKDSIVIPE